MQPTLRTALHSRSCNACGAQNYHAQSDTARTRHVDRIYEIVVDRMVSAVCPDCLHSLANAAYVELAKEITVPSPGEDAICIQVRDINGKRDTLVFKNNDAVLRWAEEEMSEEDEILLITQGGICIYSGLQADPTMALTCDDITGFFA